MSSEERITRSLDGTLPAEVPALTPATVDRVTRARIRYNMAELAAGAHANVQRWLDEVANGIVGADGRYVRAPDPARAVELFMELAQFSVPKVKAIAVDVRSRDGSVSRLSTAELQSIVSDQ